MRRETKPGIDGVVGSFPSSTMQEDVTVHCEPSPINVGVANRSCSRAFDRGNCNDGRIRPLTRALAAVCGVVLLMALGEAALLKPDPQGYGTHRQLGFPQRSVFEFCGSRCPVCGMTTARANLIRAEFVAALRANVGGTILGLVAVPGVPRLLVLAGRGRWIGWTPDIGHIVCGAVSVFVVTLIDWLSRL